MSVQPDPDRTYAIRRLFRLGMSPEAAARAVDTDRVTLSLLDHLTGGARTFTRAEAAARAGVSEEVAATVERLIGVTGGQRYSESEIRHLSLFNRVLQLLPGEVAMAQLRGDAPILRNMALRTLDTAEHTFLRDAREAIPDEIDLAVRLAEMTGPLLDTTTELVGQSYRRIVLNLLTSDMVVAALRDDSETVDLAVGFVDVVGYTSLTARIDPTGLGDVLDAFEESCLRMADAHPKVQLVKFLGDAGMFVSLDPVALARGMLRLVEEVTSDDTALGYAPIRGGLAAGPALLRGGDYFGQPVNEAARLTDLARRDTVLVADDMKDVLGGAFKMRRIRPVRLHGIGVRRPYALRGAIAEA